MTSSSKKFEIGNQVATEDIYWSLRIPTSTLDGTVTYTVTMLGNDPFPSWLTYDVGARTLRGTPLDYSGTLRFKVTAKSKTGTEVETFTLTVKEVEDAPIANADTAEVMEAGGVLNGALGSNPTGNVLGNDTDADGDSKVVSGVVAGTAAATAALWSGVGSRVSGSYGALILQADGTYAYELDNSDIRVQALQSGLTLKDTFSYTVKDTTGRTSTTTLTVTIKGANDAPVAHADAGAGTNKDRVTIDVLANDIDVDTGHVLTLVDVQNPGNKGSVKIEGDKLVFDPGSDFDHLTAGSSETVTLSYTVRDEHGAVSTATAIVTITGDASSLPPPVADNNDDWIAAGDGNDIIYGGRGNDEMHGEGGNDLIVGGTDHGALKWYDATLGIGIGDNLYSGSGNDTFVFDKGDGVDMIWDFKPGEDVITSNYLSTEARVIFVGKVGNWIASDEFQKVAILFDNGTSQEAIVFYDFENNHRDSTAITFADGSIWKVGDIWDAAQIGAVDTSALAVKIPAFAQTHRAGLKLYGNNTQDTLIGASGNDKIYGNEGVNALNGKAGDDELYGGNVQDILVGEDGNDTIYSNDGDDLVIGGRGSDKLYGAGGADIIYGDEAPDGTIPQDLLKPAGNGVSSKVEITNTWWGGFQGQITITANESVNEWKLFLQSNFRIDSIWGAEEAGRESGASSLVYDLKNAGWNGALAMGQTTTIGFTASTGVDGVVAGALLQSGLSIVASPTPNDAQGAPVINALGNTLRGAGADILVGTTNNDTFYVDDAQDRVIEAAAGGTADRVVTSVSHVLQGNVENLSAEGARSVNLTGNALSNVIEGNDAANKLAGGLGKDVLSGGRGKDAFIFNTKLSKTTNVDRIVDFNVTDDTIQLENAIFKKIGKTGKLKSDFFTVGTKAKDANDYIVYNSKTGVLYYDADGSGKGAAIQFATLSNKLKNLKVADFLVI